MIQESAKPPDVWKAGEIKKRYGNLNLYELFGMSKDGSQRRLNIYWLTVMREGGTECKVHDISYEDTDTIEHLTECMKRMVDSNLHSAKMQRRSMEKTKDEKTKQALQLVIDQHEDIAKRAEEALHELEKAI